MSKLTRPSAIKFYRSKESILSLPLQAIVIMLEALTKPEEDVTHAIYIDSGSI
jgi:hypothetical protein